MLLATFARLSRAAALKKVYASKAARDGRKGAGHLIRAIMASEKVQAHRIFSACRGRIDRSGNYLATIFEEEIPEIIARYSGDLEEAEKEGNTAVIHALRQMLDVEQRNRSRYSSEIADLADDRDREYHVCPFCGYIGDERPPSSCPVCGAKGETFQSVA